MKDFNWILIWLKFPSVFILPIFVLTLDLILHVIY